MPASRVNPTCATQGRHDGTFRLSIDCAVKLLGPGSSLRLRRRSSGTREWGACAIAARAERTVDRHPDSRCQTAQSCSFPRRVAAPGFVVFLAFAFRVRRRAHGGFSTGGRRNSGNSVFPMRGGWSADSLTLNFGRACDARPPIPGRPGITLGAPPWRFSDADPRSRLPAVEPEPHSDVPRQAL